MPTNLTENAANADFGTGLLVPQDTEDFTASCDIVTGSSFQELADRSQWLKGWLADAPKITVPVTNARDNVGPRFSVAPFAGYFQSSTADAGTIRFTVPALPIGRKIVAAGARWGNSQCTNVAIGTMPKLTLLKTDVSVGTSYVYTVGNSATIGTFTDATAVLATYQGLHDIAITGLAETISADRVYLLEFKGETGANATVGGTLVNLWVTLGY